MSVASAKAKIEEIRARNRERYEREAAELRGIFPTEIFKPSGRRKHSEHGPFRPRLDFNDYPMRAPTGALVTHQVSLGWNGPNFMIQNCAEDGTTWLTIHETLPFEFLRSF